MVEPSEVPDGLQVSRLLKPQAALEDGLTQNRFRIPFGVKVAPSTNEFAHNSDSVVPAESGQGGKRSLTTNQRKRPNTSGLDGSMGPAACILAEERNCELAGGGESTRI